MKESKMIPAVVAVSGVKNSGKTTVMEQLTERLCLHGLKVAAIKHDGHDFEPDVPGTDSFRHRKAGAYGVAVFSSHRFMVTKEAEVTQEEVISMFPEADVILLEGFKNSRYAKLEVIRKGNSQFPVCDPSFVLAYVTDLEIEDKGIQVIGLMDYDTMVNVVLKYQKKMRQLASH